jgi:nucleotide-binding universal stress UspA family protein
MDEILVGVDGSEDSKRALRWAVQEAQCRGLPIRALYAYVTVPEVAATPLTPPPPNVDLRQRAEEMLRETVADAVGDADVKVNREVIAVRGGGIAHALLDYAKDAQLLVLGSRGLGGFIGLMVGSISQQCVAHAPCPVVVVPDPKHPRR